MKKTPESIFGSYHYQRHNARRQEHLARLGLPVEGRPVLELGAGIGDHTSFFVDRGCRVTAVEVREENLDILRERVEKTWGAEHRTVRVVQGDLDSPDGIAVDPHEVVYCYGLLYHLSQPERALEWMAGRCTDLLLLETCVSFGHEDKVVAVRENQEQASQSFHGMGARPTRQWVFERLKRLFAHVYVPTTQPCHEEFPTDWTSTRDWRAHARAVFIASRTELRNPQLLNFLPPYQRRG